MIFYTAKQSGAPYSPTTQYGAWAAFTNNKINLSASTNTFIDINGSTEAVIIQASPNTVPGSGVGSGGESGDSTSAYSGPSRIVLDDDDGVVITGIKVQGNLIMTVASSTGNYRDMPPLGRYPRQRMLVEDPVTGAVMLGLGIYYKPVSYGTTTPSPTAGAAGDFLVQY
jgi:hypothetical protein